MHADWIELFELFAKHKVRYLVIGGNAVIHYGYERYTKDIDLWVSPDKENAKRVYSAVKEFGTLSAAVEQEDFEKPDNFVVMGAEPYRIDILMGPPGLDFETAYKRRVSDKRKTVTINYISLDDLIILKKAANRFVDQRDVQMLEIAKEIAEEDQE